jgi:hypothetical protein
MAAGIVFTKNAVKEFKKKIHVQTAIPSHHIRSQITF